MIIVKGLPPALVFVIKSSSFILVYIYGILIYAVGFRPCHGSLLSFPYFPKVKVVSHSY